MDFFSLICICICICFSTCCCIGSFVSFLLCSSFEFSCYFIISISFCSLAMASVACSVCCLFACISCFACASYFCCSSAISWYCTFNELNEDISFVFYLGLPTSCIYLMQYGCLYIWFVPHK